MVFIRLRRTQCEEKKAYGRSVEGNHTDQDICSVYIHEDKMAPSGLTLNKPVAFGLIALVAGGIIIYKAGWLPFSRSHSMAVTDSLNEGLEVKEIDIMNLPDYPVPKDDALKAINIKENKVDVEMKGTVHKIFFRESGPASGTPKLTVLLLHGQSFTSEDWMKISTLQYLAFWGFRAIAIDLPGYGNSRDTTVENDRAEFMEALIAQLNIKPVIISPSMSGKFALPYLFNDPSKSLERAVGFIPIAPVNSGEFLDKYSMSKLPTLVVYGSKDETGVKSKENFQRLIKSTIAVIPDGTHACYIDNADHTKLFHKALYYFLTSLEH
ncbi:protein ABHD14B-like isoform X1 [Pomacea canaliculata]|uniref:protein ABHD14B-like isoform X1 n=1 Tax=Pomacea canaliculata TaxID=400727 RepID=UPI000D72E26A|nr:protein ABHD14B-like isoform X1 [Pomacea canaliculata]